MIGGAGYNWVKDVMDDNAANTKIFHQKQDLKKFGLSPVALEAKEGLALINGTQMMTSFAAFL